MSCNNGCVRSRHGWQRPSTVNSTLAITLLLACGACGPVPRSLYQRVETLRRSDRIEEAVQLAGQGVATWRGRPDWFHRFRALKAELLVAGGRPQEALALLDSPAEVPIPQAPEVNAGYLYARGYALAQLRRNAEAKVLLEEALEIAAGARLASLQSTVLVRLGTVLFFLGDRVKAEECYRSALALADAARDSYLQARAAEALGYLDLNNSRYDECATWSARALETYRALHAEIRTASVEDNLGWCDYRLGNHDDAQALFTAAQRLFTKHRQWGALAINLNDNGAAAVARPTAGVW